MQGSSIWIVFVRKGGVDLCFHFSLVGMNDKIWP